MTRKPDAIVAGVGALRKKRCFERRVTPLDTKWQLARHDPNPFRVSSSCPSCPSCSPTVT